MIQELKQITARLLNSRSSTWDMSSETVSLLNYSVDFLKLNNRDRQTVMTMIDEYYRHYDRYKPTQWMVTAERMQAIYSISKKITKPLASDVKDIVSKLKTSSRYDQLKDDTTFKIAIGLLEYLHNYLENNQIIVNTIEDDAI